MILVMRTDKAEAEIGLYAEGKALVHDSWVAHRQLAETIHQRIIGLLNSNNATQQDLTGIVAYKGPGSFTGLRIGLSVANTLAYSLQIPIVGVNGDDWVNAGSQRLKALESDQAVMPEYGAPVHITAPKK
jgi:tRNA threonylcarbamoyladenosine biosynthesis protein TsaB